MEYELNISDQNKSNMKSFEYYSPEEWRKSNIEFQKKQDEIFLENLNCIKTILSEEEISGFLKFAEECEDDLQIVDFLWGLVESKDIQTK
jgi:hypothetical protein